MNRILSYKKVLIIFTGALISYYSLLQNFTPQNNRSYERLFLLIGLFLIFIYNMKLSENDSKADKRMFLILGIIFGSFWTIGRFALYYGNYSETEHKLLKLLLCLLGAVVLFTVVTSFIYHILIKINEQDSPKGMSALLFTLITFLAAAVMLLINYPGVSFTDGLRQMENCLGILEWKNHDPAFSSLIIGRSIALGHELKDYNFGMFIYNVLMLIFSTVVFFMVIRELNSLGTKRFWNILFTVFYVTLPIIRYYLITVCKDTSYAFTALYITVILLRMKNLTGKEDKVRLSLWIKLFILFLLSCNLRNDGIYVALFTLVVSFFCFKGLDKKAFIVGIAALLGVFHIIYGALILPAAGIGEGSVREALSVPLQQTAYLMQTHPETYNDEETAELDRFFEGHLSELAEVYDPNLSDPVKGRMVFYPAEGQVAGYFKLWFKGLKEHPFTYIKAYIFNYYGYIYPDMTGNEAGFYCNAFSPNYPNDFNFSQLPQTQGIRDLMCRYTDWFKNTAGLSLLYNPGFYTWVLIFCIAVIFRTDKRKLFCLAPSLAVILIACLSPVNCRVRYVLTVILCIPVILALTFSELEGRRTNGNEAEER